MQKHFSGNTDTSKKAYSTPCSNHHVKVGGCASYPSLLALISRALMVVIIFLSSSAYAELDRCPNHDEFSTEYEIIFRPGSIRCYDAQDCANKHAETFDHVTHRANERVTTYAYTVESIKYTYNLNIAYYKKEKKQVVTPTVSGTYYSTSDGLASLKMICEESQYILVPHTSPEQCGEGNPCNPSTGNKFQIETDYEGAGSNSLEFKRYYNSQDNARHSHHLGKNWRHSYSSSLNLTPLSYDTANGNTSSKYATASQACVDGLTEIKGDVWAGGLPDGVSSEKAGNSLCRIKSGSKTIAWFSIVKVSKTGGGASISPPTLNYRTISKPDGSSYVFAKAGNDQWINLFNPDVKLEQMGSNWLFTNKNNNKEIYNAAGQLISIIPSSGRELTLNYNLDDASGGDNNPSTLDKVTDTSGRSLVLNYIDPLSINKERLSIVSTPDGDLKYGYGGVSSQLIVSTYPDSSRKVYRYTNPSFPSHLTSINDEKFKDFATWAYHADGKAASSEHANGVEKVTLAYNADGTTTVNGALGDTRTYNFTVERGARRVSEITGDQCRTCGNGFMKTRTYDANGFLNGYTDWQGNQTSIINNPRGLPTQQIDAVGTVQERTTSTVWHNTLNLPLIITEPSRETTLTYTDTGQLLSRTITDMATNESRITTYAYHSSGANGAGLIASVDASRDDVNDITLYDYDTQDNLNNITNALGHETLITSHDASGRPLSITDANNVTTQLTWDLRGRLLTITVLNNSGADSTTTFEYDPVGQLIKATQADGSFLAYIYDDAHRLTGISDNADNKIKYGLDKVGNRTSTSTTDTAGNISFSQTAIFDKLSHLKQSLGANSQKQLLNYDLNHNPLDSTDALNHQTQSNYDALDRLIKSIDPDAQETNFEYDNQDNLTKVTDAKGLETTYVYNGFDEIISQTSPDTGITTYTYDKVGNRTSMSDARGVTVNYTYDELNRQLTTDYANTTLKM